MRRWTEQATLVCGTWLLFQAVSVDYQSVWLVRSDVLGGGVIVLLSLAMLAGAPNWLRWVQCAVGVWLLFAPLWFWAPNPATYSLDTLVGCLVVAFSGAGINLNRAHLSAAEAPPGWDYNPSAWSQRMPIIGLALLGFFMAKYLSAYQLGYVSSAWDPFFGQGTERILRSDVSRAFPVSDAGLGAFSYLVDALSGGIGNRDRWKTMPWMVILFGAMIIPPGVTSITLVVLQPLAVGSWCTICLFTAVVTLLMVPPAVDEVVAAIQFMIASKKKGQSLWRVFWLGDRTIAQPMLAVPQRPPKAARHRVAGYQLAVTFFGILLMALPAIFDLQKALAANAYISGALVTSLAITAIAEVARPIRFVNVLVGLWLLASAIFLGPLSLVPRLVLFVLGLGIVGFSLPLGKISNRYGDYDRWIYWSPETLKGRRRPSRAA